MHRPRLLAVLGLAIAADASAQPALRPLPSSRATAEIVLDYPQGQAPPGAQSASIRIDYGVPHLRGRRLHTDSLVPYNVPWRTGANARTTLRTDVDLVIGGATVPRGTYALFTLPSPQGWKLIVQDSAAISENEYNSARDKMRIDLRHTTLPQPLESLTVWLIPSTAPGVGRGELRISWATTQLSVDWSVK